MTTQVVLCVECEQHMTTLEAFICDFCGDYFCEYCFIKHETADEDELRMYLDIEPGIH